MIFACRLNARAAGCTSGLHDIVLTTPTGLRRNRGVLQTHPTHTPNEIEQAVKMVRLDLYNKGVFVEHKPFVGNWTTWEYARCHRCEPLIVF